MTLVDDKIKEMFEQGKNDSEIATVVGATPNTIYTHRRILGLLRQVSKNPELKAKVIELRKSGKSYGQIQKELNINEKTVSRMCYDAGIEGESLPRKEFLKVHFNNLHIENSSFVISCGSWYIRQLDVDRSKELVAKVTPEKPNKFIIEIFEKDKIEGEKDVSESE